MTSTYLPETFVFHGTLLRVVDEVLVTAMGADVRDENGKVVRPARAFEYTSVRVSDD